MDTKIDNFFKSLRVFFNGCGHRLPCYDSDYVFQWECIYADCSNEKKSKNRRYVLKALVFSEHSDDVKVGITLLEGSLLHTSNPKEKRKEMYLLAVGYYRSGEYSKSKELNNACLELLEADPIKKNSVQYGFALSLKDLIEDGLKKDEVAGTLMAVATAIGVVASLFSSTTTKSSYPTSRFEEITFTDLNEDLVKKDAATSLTNTNNPLQMKEEMYLLSHRYYLRRDYLKSTRLINCCLEIAPEWMPAITLKKSIEDGIKKGEVTKGIWIGVAATTFCVAAGSVMSKKK